MSTIDSDLEFDALLNYLKQNRGCDLTGYKRPTLMRRSRYRMQQLRIETYGNYLDYLWDHPEECTPLLNTIWINYSSFFRDADSWDYLAKEIIPNIITSKQSQEPIRVWSAGCASGQEVYTLAILLVEALGMEQYLQRVQIFATDIDQDALNQAQQASYRHEEIAGIPSELRSKYTHQVEQRHVFDLKLRCRVILSRHDLAENAPMSKIDLLVCRNVLMYFTPQIQTAILVRFHFALSDNGYFFLGNAETFTSSRHLFMPISLKHRIFAKGQTLTLQDHLLLRSRRDRNQIINFQMSKSRIWQASFETSPFAQLAVDCKGRLLLINQQARTLFGLQNGDLGTQVQKLEVGQLVDPWALIRRLDRNHHAPFSLKQIKWDTDQGTTYLDIHIAPISDLSGRLLGVNITFIIDDTRDICLKDKRERSSTLAGVTPRQIANGTLDTTNKKPESTQK